MWVYKTDIQAAKHVGVIKGATKWFAQIGDIITRDKNHVGGAHSPPSTFPKLNWHEHLKSDPVWEQSISVSEKGLVV